MAGRSLRRAAAEAGAVVTVEAIGLYGDGLARLDADWLAVPGTAPGDRVRVVVEPAEDPRGQRDPRGRRAQHGQRAQREQGAQHGQRGQRGPLAATAVELIAPGPDRQEAPCPAFGRCGGCRVQHLGPATQADWKRRLVAEGLARQDLGDVPVGALQAVPPASRRRVTLAARTLGGAAAARIVLGFHEAGSSRIVDIDDCPVAVPAITAALDTLRGLAAAWLPVGGRGDLAVTALEDGLDVVLIGEGVPDADARQDLAAMAAAAGLARLSHRTSPGAPADPIALLHPGTVRAGGVSVVLPPGGFLQPTAEGEALLVRLVGEAVGEATRVADLFCGIGTFALPLAAAGRVLAVEGDASAVAALADAARQAGPRVRLEAVRRDLYREPLTPPELDRFDAVVFDPPRNGAREQARALAASRVATVVGVSCQPASFARDARILVDGGFRLVSVTPVDQFLWSPHVELVGVFQR